MRNNSKIEEILSGSISSIQPIIGKISSPQSIVGELSVIYESEEDRIPIYTGDEVITPKPFETQILQTQNKRLLNNIEVLEIPYYETSNTSGITIFIGGN